MSGFRAATSGRSSERATPPSDSPGIGRRRCIVCATYNLVFDGDRAVGVIDWDFASPGPRLWDLVYLAYCIVPLSQTNRADGFTDRQRQHRLHRLQAAYGTGADAREIGELLQEQLLDLAAFSDLMAVRLDKPELAEHADVYRHDAAHLPPG